MYDSISCGLSLEMSFGGSHELNASKSRKFEVLSEQAHTNLPSERTEHSNAQSFCLMGVLWRHQRVLNLDRRPGIECKEFKNAKIQQSKTTCPSRPWWISSDFTQDYIVNFVQRDWGFGTIRRLFAHRKIQKRQSQKSEAEENVS